MGKKLIALMLALCLVFALVVPSFAANRSLLHYKSVSFLGDSISLGYTNLVGYEHAYDTFDDRYVLSASATSMQEIEEGNFYTTSYPYVFGEIAGTDLNGVYNYGIPGAMAVDIDMMLQKTPEELGKAFAEIEGINFLREGFKKSFRLKENGEIKNQTSAEYLVKMQKRVLEENDLVAIALGGNDVYQNILCGYQFGELFKSWSMDSLASAMENMGTLGLLVSVISSLMQFEADISSILELIEGLSQLGNYGKTETRVENSLSQESLESKESQVTAMSIPTAQAAPDMSGISSLLSGLSEDIMKMLKFYSAEEMMKYFTATTDIGRTQSILDEWKTAYTSIVNKIYTTNKTCDIAVISQYNPFGIENYLQFLALKWEKEQLKDDLGLDVNTALRAVRTLIDKLTGTEETVGSSNWVSMAVEALQTALNNCLPAIDLVEDNDNLYELIADIAYPVMVLMMGNSLQPIYDEMNGFLKNLVKNYPGHRVFYVDISDAPCSGRMDPHPGPDMHAWIAQRIYDSLVASKYYLPAPTSTVKVMVSTVKNVVKLAKDYLSNAAQSGDGATPVNTSIMQQFLNMQKTFWEKLFQLPTGKLSQS